LAHRHEDAETAPFLTELRARWPSGADVRNVAVGPLGPDDAKRLALSLLGPSEESDQLADVVARESMGNPFFADELARGGASRLTPGKDARVTIEQVLADRVAELPEDARRLLEIVAVGGRPLPVSMLSEAAGIESAEDAVAILAARRFVRPGLRAGREVAEPIHDRIRETIASQLSPDLLP